MVHEIVPAEPLYQLHDQAEASTSYSTSLTSAHQPQREHVPQPFDSERLPPTLVSGIQRFLRVANLIEIQEPRIAYLCRFHALVIAHKMDRNSNERGVRQFKTALLQRLEQDEDTTMISRREGSTDIRELKRVYHSYEDHISRKSGVLASEERIASVLDEVLRTMINPDDPQALANGDSSQAERKFFVPYNILPLHHVDIQHAILQIPEIKAAIAAVRYTRGLPPAQDFQKSGSFIDLFEFLQHCFGFQEGNVANQREHLILLLANVHIRQSHKQSSVTKLGDGALDELMKKFFKNYTNWCKFLGTKNNIRLPVLIQDAQQYKILYMGLYLLIWGEAANLRFMPECLCYIFHHMAYELHAILVGGVSMNTEENVPAYGGGFESFLITVVTPIYRVIYEEAVKSKSGTADHSTWRNYDDLNEFFWSPDCFRIGWPMRLDHDFFCVQSADNCKVKKAQTSLDFLKKKGKKPSPDHSIRTNYDELNEKEDEEQGVTTEEIHEPKWLGKTNFVEIRSFWQIFRSFDRMWSFFILSLQAMIIMACHDVGSPVQIFGAVIFEDIMSIFVTSAFLKLIQAIFDVAFTWKARQTMDYSQKKKYVLRLGVAVIWTIVLPLLYARSRRKYTCYSTQYKSWLGELCFSSYMVAVTMYLMTNAVELVLFFVPAIRKHIEISNFRMCTMLSWWTQPRLYVGRGMQETQLSQFKYTFFWTLVLLAKFLFSYSFEIKPLIAPTRLIMKIGVQNYAWHELFPKVKSNAGAIVAVWAPIIVVYFMDTQIWYSVFCTIFGGLYGILHHLGEIRTLGMLRSRFDSLPFALNACLIPRTQKNNNQRKRTSLFRRFHKISEGEKDAVAKFILVWNQIVNTFRSEDLISNRELDLMTMPMSSELFTGMIRWPIFLLANKFSTALTIARDFVGKDETLFKRIRKDKYMYCAVKECYESLKFILVAVVDGDLEKRVIFNIVNEIEESIERSSLLEEFKISELVALQAKCTELVELLLEGNETQHDKVVKVLQDIFEVVTNDIMIDGSRVFNLLNTYQQVEVDFSIPPEYIRPQLFADKSSIRFPLPDSGPSKEQMKRFLLLLTVKDKVMDIPANLEARRRISFFATSLFMDMPHAPKVRNMLSFRLNILILPSTVS